MLNPVSNTVDAQVCSFHNKSYKTEELLCWNRGHNSEYIPVFLDSKSMPNVVVVSLTRVTDIATHLEREMGEIIIIVIWIISEWSNVYVGRWTHWDHEKCLWCPNNTWKYSTLSKQVSFIERCPLFMPLPNVVWLGSRLNTLLFAHHSLGQKHDNNLPVCKSVNWSL